MATRIERRPRPIIDGMFRIPTRLLEGRVTLQALQKELTAKYVDMSAGTTTDVPMYTMRGGSIAVPRKFGRERFPDLWNTAEDRTIKPSGKCVHFPIQIEPDRPGQPEFVNDLMSLFGDNVIDAQATAATGSGKTASACMMQAFLGLDKPMLVIVTTNRLKEGWLGNVKQGKGLRFFYGDEWVRRNVGVVQQDECNYQGKRIVIAMAPSLCSRRYPPEFYEQFCIVVIDEVHKMATPVLNRVLGMFPAYAHIGLTATPKGGKMGKVPIAHIGRPCIVSTQEVRQPKVCRVLFDEEFDFCDDDGDPIDNRNSLITYLSRNKRRQALITDLVYVRGFARNRQCLVLSDRTDQLLDIRRRLLEYGVRERDIGMYVGAYKTGKYKLTGSIRSGKYVKHFRGLPGFNSRASAERYVRDAKRSLSSSASVRIGDIEDCTKLAPERHKPTPEDYERIERSCRVVLATYGIFDTGIDIKRLDWGIEASMRGDVAQAVGRILRILDGKPVPEWYSIYDRLHTLQSREIMGETVTNTYYHHTPKRLEKQRRASYDKQNAILVHMDKPHEALEKAKAALGIV